MRNFASSIADLLRAPERTVEPHSWDAAEAAIRLQVPVDYKEADRPHGAVIIDGWLCLFGPERENRNSDIALLIEEREHAWVRFRESGIELSSKYSPETIDVWYGWAHHGRMCRMLAAEEGVRLEVMEGFGGTTPWTPAVSAVAPIPGPENHDRREVSVDECRQMRPRLEEISVHWDQERFAEPVEDEMAVDQAVSLHKMLAVIAWCIESDQPMIIS